MVKTCLTTMVWMYIQLQLLKTIGGEKVYKFENSYSVGQNIWPYAYTKDIAFVNGNNYTMSYDI